MDEGLRARCEAGAVVYSAYPMPPSPRLGKRTSPKTSSPSRHDVTPSPTATTTPEMSDPGVKGRGRGGRRDSGMEA